ncbi:hypothetical protein BDV33DRAFT_201472 [Aspergillus novoparasiticus]|uniref:Uncharacterized protein n=1 Tax=Aspergillus novoparasiticus TaxID=986946 RepID=A0A5N6F0Z5_9EURO|nr:hypothetical protein BDV33DRAFT_201472 [Aspergillus novoparasiticus]
MSDFDTLLTKRNDVFTKVGTVLNEEMKKQGFETREQLQEHIRQQITNSNDLKKFDDFKKQLDKKGTVENIILDTVCLVGIGTVVGSGILAMLGIISGPLAWSIVACVGTVAAIAGVLEILNGVISGALERKALQNGIAELWHKRALAKYYLNRLDTLVSAVQALGDTIELGNKASLAKMIKKTLGHTYRQVGPWNIREELRKMDERNKSWTTEDPPLYTLEEFTDTIRAEVVYKNDWAIEHRKAKVQKIMEDGKSCILAEAGHFYEITAQQKIGESTKVDDVLFSYKEMDENWKEICSYTDLKFRVLEVFC